MHIYLNTVSCFKFLHYLPAWHTWAILGFWWQGFSTINSRVLLLSSHLCNRLSLPCFLLAKARERTANIMLQSHVWTRGTHTNCTVKTLTLEQYQAINKSSILPPYPPILKGKPKENQSYSSQQPIQTPDKISHLTWRQDSGQSATKAFLPLGAYCLQSQATTAASSYCSQHVEEAVAALLPVNFCLFLIIIIIY